MSTPDLGAIRRRILAATVSPWDAHPVLDKFETEGEWEWTLSTPGSHWIIQVTTDSNDHAEAVAKAEPKAIIDFIAHAPADLAALCDRVEALEKAVRQISVGKIVEDYGAGDHRSDLLCAARLCAIARAALAADPPTEGE